MFTRKFKAALETVIRDNCSDALESAILLIPYDDGVVDRLLVIEFYDNPNTPNPCFTVGAVHDNSVYADMGLKEAVQKYRNQRDSIGDDTYNEVIEMCPVHFETKRSAKA